MFSVSWQRSQNGFIILHVSKYQAACEHARI